MSRFTGYFRARKPADDSERPPEPEADADLGEQSSHDDRSHDDPSRDVFELAPPPPANANSADPSDDTASVAAMPPEEPQPAGRNIHSIGITDLSRLSIDNDGRLYWDGKPVEVRRRILMSRPQVVSFGIVAAFVVIGAVGAAIQGSAAALDWACRLGWTTNYCTPTEASPPPLPPRPDIPA
jgi:hypothetical protein